MKKLAIIFLSASILSSAAFAVDDNVVATYKGGDVKESQVMQQFKPALDMAPANKDKKFSELDGNLQEALVKGYINFKLLEQEAKNQGIENLPEFQEKLNKAKAQLVQQELLERFVKNTVTDKMIDAEYDNLVARLKGKKEIKVSHILVANDAEAKAIKVELNKNSKKFEAIAKKSSQDTGSKASGGEIGYVIEGQLVPEFEQKAFSMKVNEISDPVKTQFGWHIIKVSDSRDIKIPTKDEARAGLNDKLSSEAIQKYFADLAAKADIKLNLPKVEATKPVTMPAPDSAPVPTIKKEPDPKKAPAPAA
jgi:parvulin-like peptidyl-prolyl isomerase